MPRKKHTGASGESPIGVGSSPQPTTVNGRLRPETYGGAEVTLFSNDPQIVLTARLRGPVSRPLPRPRIETVDRRGRVGLSRWTGRDPYVMVVPITLNGYPHGPVEDDIRKLERLALRHGDDSQPPIVQLAGPIPAPAGMANPKWRISDLQEVPDRTVYNANGRCSRLAVDVTLTEHVADRLFVDSADDSAATGFGKRIRNRKTTMRKGETFADVARRIFHDRSRAKDIARANGLRLGFKATKDFKIRLP